MTMATLSISSRLQPLRVLWMFVVLVALAPGTAQVKGVNAVDLFDRALARGLPQAIVLPSSGDKEGGDEAERHMLVIESPLDVELRFQGSDAGDVTGTMYLATWQGEPAVVTRSGRHLDISVHRTDRTEVTGFSSDTDESHHVSDPGEDLGRPVIVPEGLAQPIDEARTMPVLSTAVSTAGRQRRSVVPPTLIFWMFMHDDTLGMSRQHVHANYVAWWIADMKRILPTRRLWAIYSQQIAGVTDIPYGHASSLVDWTSAIDHYARREKLPLIRGVFEYKFMLVTNEDVAPGVAGLAWLGGDEAMATLKGRYTIIAHEYGHTLNAVHDDAEIRWSTKWPCETNLRSNVNMLLANCYRYSAANERRMRSYAANEWTVPVRPDPPGIPLRAVE
jgi:hypothetical protein